MKIAIYGSGGLGGYYGARLAQAGNDVHFIARGAHLDAMKANGLRVMSPLGDAHVPAPQATDDPGTIGPCDAVIVAVKTWQVPEVARAMQPLVKDDTRIVPFLNGVEAASQLAEVHGEQRVLGGLSRVFSFIEAPGVIRHFNPSAYIQIGDIAGGVSPGTAALRDVFEHAGVEAETSDDMHSEIWKKLLLVSSWAGLGALTGCPLGELLEHAETKALIETSIDEGIAVAVANGAKVDAGQKDIIWNFYNGLPRDVTASMMRDILEGKPSELDAWNGAIVRFGEAAGVPVPTHRTIYHALLPLERRARAEA